LQRPDRRRQRLPLGFATLLNLPAGAEFEFVVAFQFAGDPGTLPPTRHDFEMDVELLDRVVGSEERSSSGRSSGQSPREDESDDVEEISTGEPLMLTVGTATTVGSVTSARDGECEVTLKRPVCAPDGATIAINRRVGARWRLIGIGTLQT